MVPGRKLSGAVFAADSLRTLNGARITPSVSRGTAFVDGAPIRAADIKTSNGIIHVIGGVLLP